MGGQRHAPAALPPRITQYPLYRRLGGPQGSSGRFRKTSPPPVFDPRTVHSVASRYINWAIPAHTPSFLLCIRWKKSGPFPREYNGRSVMLTVHLRLVPRLSKVVACASAFPFVFIAAIFTFNMWQCGLCVVKLRVMFASCISDEYKPQC
jgi:hypothetical protein